MNSPSESGADASEFGTEESRTEESRTEESRTEESSAEESSAEESSAEESSVRLSAPDVAGTHVHIDAANDSASADSVEHGTNFGFKNPEQRRFSKPMMIATGVLALFILGLVVVLFATSPTQQAAINSRAIIGQQAPPIVAQTLNGGNFNLSHHQGKWVVVSFFASWCPGCVLEIPELEEFYERRGEQNVVVVTVVITDIRSKVEDSPAGDVPWPVVFEETVTVTDKIGLDYGVIQLPETFVISPQGQVVEKLIGVSGVTADSLDRVIINEIQRQAEQLAA